MHSLLAHVLLSLAAATAQPSLHHSAPFLGRTLQIRVAGAPANQPAVLLYSPRAAHVATAFGLLEIERHSSHRVALGTTNANGRWTVQLPIPLDAALAEVEAHFQALIDDPSAPAGKVLSRGVHVRLLGTRVYVDSRETDGGDPALAELVIASAVHDAIIATVPLGAAPNIGVVEPVFSPSFARGAVMASAGELVIFDPFFGAVLDTVPFQGATPRIFLDEDGNRALVLELGSASALPQPIPARLSAVDLATGQVVAQLSLPKPALDRWCLNAARTEAYIAEIEDLDHDSFVRRIDLVTWTDLGAIAVGETGVPFQRIDEMLFAAGQVIVTAHPGGLDPGGLDPRSSLTRIDLSPWTPVTSVQFDPPHFHITMAALPNVDRLILFRRTFGLTSQGFFRTTPLSATGPIIDLPVPPEWNDRVIAHVLEPEEDGLWVLDRAGDILLQEATEPGRLYFVDLVTNAWTMFPHEWGNVGPSDIEVVHDALANKLVLSTRSTSAPGSTPGELYVFDRATQTVQHVPLAHSGFAATVVPVP
ncbi:MAG: YncE family protein [Planctomycetota bacterium]